MSLTLMSVSAASDAIYAWVDGDEICYRLSEMPKVVYSNDKTEAWLYSGDKMTPVLTVKLYDSKILRITYGVYDETKSAVEDAVNNDAVRKSGKYIYGGQLIIVDKDGRQYNAQGQRIVNRDLRVNNN